MYVHENHLLKEKDILNHFIPKKIFKKPNLTLTLILD